MSFFWTRLIVKIVTAFMVGLALCQQTATAAPSAEVAKRCLHYAYIVYPYKRPGAVPMSGDRQAYFQDCKAKNGEVPEPTGAAAPASAKPPQGPAPKAGLAAAATPSK
jgi:hypothetical protein